MRKGDYPVYSPFARATAPTPQWAAATFHEVCIKCRWPRETYPVLPWSLHQLDGTNWCNIHCGSLVRVGSVEHDYWDHPVLPILSKHSWGELTWVLGLWWEGRYVVEDWVRVDLLSQQEQVRWGEFRLAYIATHIRQDEQRLIECAHEGDRVNTKWREEDLARDLQEKAYAEMQLRACAERAR